MKKTLVIVDHPALDLSVVNRRFIEELRKYPDEFLVHSLQSSYPSGVIDAAREHSLIDNNGMIVLQFPLYWYTCPPQMKLWFDTVLTSDWAFSKAFKLENKKIALAVTCGSEAAAYTSEGRHHCGLENYLLPMIHSFEMCHAVYAGLYAFYGTADKSQATVENIAKAAEQYVEFLRNLKE